MNVADPRVRRTRKLIVEAFFALMGEKGFQAISVQEIAERATVNRATFYTHFDDKYALMDWVVRDTFREALARRLGPAPGFTLDNLRLLVVTVCEFLSQFHGHCTPGNRSVEPPLEAKLQEELSTFLLGWLRQVPLAQPLGHADGAAGVTPAAMAALLSWAIFGAGIEWSRGAGQQPAAEWARDVVGTLVSGLARFVALPVEEALPQRVG